MLPTAHVLDASAVLAVIQSELRPEDAAPWLAGSCISTVNLSEVVAKLAEKGYSEQMIMHGLAALKLDARPFDRTQAQRAGLLRPLTRSRGLSLGDRACLALAIELGWPVATTDRAWAELDIGIAVQLVR